MDYTSFSIMNYVCSLNLKLLARASKDAEALRLHLSPEEALSLFVATDSLDSSRPSLSEFPAW